MATREEIVIGYQLIHKANTINRVIDGASLVLQCKDPRNETPLMFKPGATPAQQDAAIPQLATVAEIKKQATTCAYIITKQAKMVDEFLSRYGNPSAIDSGLDHFHTPLAYITRDVSEVKTHKNNMVTALGLVTTKESLSSNGQLLALYKPQVDLEVTHDLIPIDQQFVNTYQDLLSAIALELRGLHEDSGVLTYFSVKQRKEMVNGRLKTAGRWYPKVAGMSEVIPMKQMFDYVTANLDGITTTIDLEIMADYLDNHVPQVPAVRRWWNF